MKVLVTGGAGYIGSHMVLALINAGHTPVVLDNFAHSSDKNIKTIEKLTNTKIQLIEHDLRNPLDNLDLKGIDAITHFAAFKSVGESVEQPLMYYENNVYGTINLLKAAQKNNIKNLVFSSTCAIFGDPATEQVTEDTKVDPKSPYGASKMISERVITDYCASKGMSAALLRYFNVAGNADDGSIGDLDSEPQTLIPSIMLSYLGIRPFKFKLNGTDYPTKDGTCIRDYIHVLDLVDGHLKALNYLNQNQGVHAFNLGTGKGTSVLDIIKAFEKITGDKLDYEVAPRRPGDAIAIFANPKKANNLLGWSGKRNIEDMISSMLKWYKETYKT